jgi:hypothetical protein
MIPIIPGTPLSNANQTCASCVSLGAKDIDIMSLFNRYAPQLATLTSTKRTRTIHIRPRMLLILIEQMYLKIFG